jgi:hypothetical protein
VPNIVGEYENKDLKTMTGVLEVTESVILAFKHILLIISAVKRQF